MTESRENFFSGPARSSQLASTESLCRRIAEGDRIAAAEFVRRYGPSIRQRYRVRLSSSLRRLMDSADLLSTLGRRLDALVAEGNVRATDEKQLWGLLHQMARSAIIDKSRLLRKIQSAEADDRFWAAGLERRLAAEPIRFDAVIDHAFDALPSEVDRQILALWLGDSDFDQIALVTGMRRDAVRQRWQRIRKRLSSVLAEHDDSSSPEVTPQNGKRGSLPHCDSGRQSRLHHQGAPR